jgi:hypothetical protein
MGVGRARSTRSVVRGSPTKGLTTSTPSRSWSACRPSVKRYGTKPPGPPQRSGHPRTTASSDPGESIPAQEASVDRHRTPGQQVADCCARFAPRRRALLRDCHVELLQDLKAGPATSTLVQPDSHPASGMPRGTPRKPLRWRTVPESPEGSWDRAVWARCITLPIAQC